MTLAVDEQLVARIARRVVAQPNGCWDSEHKSVGKGGYHRIVVHGTYTTVHRAMYQAMRGAVPQDLQLDHLCRNTACCNPAHLEPVTAAENTRRARARITHCPRGHLLAGSNLLAYALSKGKRSCKTCHRDRVRAARTERTSA